MHSLIRKTINLKVHDLLKAEDLEQAVQNLHTDCLSNLNERTNEEASRCFWLSLARQGVLSRSTALAALTAKQLNLNKSMILSHLSSQKLDGMEDQSILRYLANYLQINDDDMPLKQQEIVNDNNSFTIQGRLLNKFLEHYDWTGALESFGTSAVGSQRQEQLKRLVSNMQARYYETEENFSECIIHYEESDTQVSHSLRALLKHLIGSTHNVLEDYCSTMSSLREFWPKYLVACGKFSEASKYYERQGDLINLLNCNLLAGKLDQYQLINFLPGQLRQFIEDSDPSHWSEKKTVELVASLGTTLDSTQRRALFNLSSFYWTHNDMLKSCSIDLCLGDHDRFLLKSSYLFDPLKTIQLTEQFGSHHQLVSRLMDHMTQQCSGRVNNRVTQLESRVLFTAYLNLGLIDECLQTFSRANQKDLTNIKTTVEFISKQINAKHDGSLNLVSPEIRPSTLKSIREYLVDENDKDLTTHVIAVVILSLNIFLLKLEINDALILNESIPKLESMFQNLCELSNELGFNASDGLIRASHGLIAAVKSKLDALIDSNPIREGFQQLIETTAGRCMMEGRYKSAAMLYSQIEDNVSAVKSLMRTGEVETVIDYALLVRDITVNRITINYLKHLRTDQDVIEDFITRSRI